MNYENLLATQLSESQEEKLAAHFESYSIEELESLLKTKTSAGVLPGLVGGLIGAHALGRSPLHGAGLGVATALGAKAIGAGLRTGTHSADEEKRAVDKWKKERAKKKKASSADSETVVMSWARNMAQDDMEKQAFMGAVAGMVNKAAPMLAKGIGALGRSTMGQAAGVGALGGAALNVGRHIMSRPDPMTGQRRGSVLGAAAKGAIAGGALGAGAKALHGVPQVGQAVQKMQQGGGLLSGSWKPASAASGAVSAAPAAAAGPTPLPTPGPVPAGVPMGAATPRGEMASMQSHWAQSGLSPAEIQARMSATGRRAERLRGASNPVVDPAQARAARMQQQAAGQGMQGVVNRHRAGPNAAVFGKTGSAILASVFMKKAMARNSTQAQADVGSFSHL